MYKKIINHRGTPMYYKNNKLVSKNIIPADELEKLDNPEPKRELPRFDALAGLDVTVLDEEGGLDKYHPTLHHDMTVADEDAVPENKEEVPLYDVPENCLFCGGDNEFQKTFNLEGRQYTVNLCSDDYYSKNLGKMVGKLRSYKHESVIG